MVSALGEAAEVDAAKDARYFAGDNGQLVVTDGQVIVGAMLSQYPADRILQGFAAAVLAAHPGTSLTGVATRRADSP